MIQIKRFLFEGESSPSLPLPENRKRARQAGLEGPSPAVLSLMLTAVDVVPQGSQNHLNIPGMQAKVFFVLSAECGERRCASGPMSSAFPSRPLSLRMASVYGVFIMYQALHQDGLCVGPADQSLYM